MMLHNEYLTDEQLNQLISEAEADLMPAPPELADNILKAIRDAEEQETVVQRPEELSKETTKIKRKKNLDFAAYCFRVGMAAAAAIAFIFIMPDWEMEDVREYPTREEVLNDTSILQKVFGEEGIFTGNYDFNNMKEENGGE